MLLIIACIIAGAFGVMHDQITYSISEEYYTKFKFIQFMIPPALQNRIGVSIVGISATWWMGFIIGVIIIPFSYKCASKEYCNTAAIKSFAIVAITTSIVSISAMVWGFLFSEKTTYYFEIPNDIVMSKEFYIVGNMHNFSYLGGLIGLLVAIAYLLNLLRLRTLKNKS